MTIEEVSIPSADGSFDIHGTLKLPPSPTVRTNKVPAILIINGSGPIDRHGNVKMSGIMSIIANVNLNTSNMLSDYLVNHQQLNKGSKINSGMAALTYDKRGIGKSVNAEDSNFYYKAGVTELVSDAVQAFQFLVTRSSADNNSIDVNNIFIAGHSEGAILLPLILRQLKEDNSSVLPKGLIFLCGFGQCLRDVMASQRETLVQEVGEQKGIKGWILRQFLTKERLDKQYKDSLDKCNNKDIDYLSTYFGLLKTPAKWFREHLELGDLRSELSQVDCHCLAIAGGNDRQVSSKFCQPNVAVELVPNAASLETHILPHMTHLLRSMEKPCQLLDATTEYPRLGKLPLDSDLLSIIKKWSQRTSVEKS